MSRLIAVYGSPDSRWEDALRWARDNGYKTRVTRQRCYKGINHRAEMYYASSQQIVDDYAIKGTERLSDEELDDGSE